MGQPAAADRADPAVTTPCLHSSPARDLLLAFSFVAMDDDIVEAAMNEPDRGLRSLDAIHLATARILGEDLDALVSYDDRLLKAAIRCRPGHGVSPGLDRRAEWLWWPGARRGRGRVGRGCGHDRERTPDVRAGRQ